MWCMLFSISGASSHFTTHILILFIVSSVRTNWACRICTAVGVHLSDQSWGCIIWCFHVCIFAVIMICNPWLQMYSVSAVGLSIQLYQIGFVSEFLTANCWFPNSIMVS